MKSGGLASLRLISVDGVPVSSPEKNDIKISKFG